MITRPIILAGGLGTRLRNLVDDRPKVLADINGIPFLQIIINQLFIENFKEITILIGYKGHMIKNYFGNKFKGIQIFYISEDQLLGTGGAVKNAAISSPDDMLLVLNGDTYHNVARLSFINAVSNDKNGILCKELKNPSRYGIIKIDNNNLITKFNEKRKVEGKNLINTGTYLIKKKDIISFDKTDFSLEKDFFPFLIQKKTLQAIILNGSFIDIGIPEDLERARKIF